MVMVGRIICGGDRKRIGSDVRRISLSICGPIPLDSMLRPQGSTLAADLGARFTYRHQPKKPEFCAELKSWQRHHHRYTLRCFFDVDENDSANPYCGKDSVQTSMTCGINLSRILPTQLLFAEQRNYVILNLYQQG